jgi:thymidylate synthase (FAD)
MDKGHTIFVLDKGYVRLIDWLGDDKRIIEAARVSYKSPSKGEEQDKKLLQYLWKHQHTSPLEQCNITFNIKLPIFVMRQFVRHRTFKLNEQSARYSEMADDFYIPTNWRKQDTKNKQGSVDNGNWNPIIDWGVDHITATDATEEICKSSYILYKNMIEYGIAKEMARMILPVNLYTEIYVNCDLHNLLHFLTLRLDSHAQYEIQIYAKAIYDIAKELYPVTINAFDRYKFEVKDKLEEKSY